MQFRCMNYDVHICTRNIQPILFRNRDINHTLLGILRSPLFYPVFCKFCFYYFLAYFKALPLAPFYVIHSLIHTHTNIYIYIKLRGFESASELYRSGDRRLPAKLVPTLADRAQRVPSTVSSIF
jgi:hypothetical protein